MPAQIVGIRGPCAGQTFPVGDKPISFGRTPENTVVIDSPLTSRKHAELRLTIGGYVVRDLNSSNGTYVNGEPITSRALKHGDVIEIGEGAFRYEELPAEPPPPSPPGAPAYVDGVRGALAGQRFPIGLQPTSFGRTPDNAIVVDSPMASRRHAEIRFEAGSFVIYDLRSSNGTIVNGRKVSEQLLRPGDVIEIGGEAFRFDLASSAGFDRTYDASGAPPPIAWNALNDPQAIAAGSGPSVQRPPSPLVSNQPAPPVPAPPPLIAPPGDFRPLEPKVVPLGGFDAPAPPPFRPLAPQVVPLQHAGPAPIAPPPPGFATQAPGKIATLAPPPPLQGFSPSPGLSRPPFGGPPLPPPIDPRQREVRPPIQCPTCGRHVDAQYQDCPWDGTALMGGRTAY